MAIRPHAPIDPALTIAAGALPASGAEPWWSGPNGGGTAGADSLGHMVEGSRIDEAWLYLSVSDWDGVTELELLVQRHIGGSDGSTGRWAAVEPLPLVGVVGNRIVSVDTGASGKVFVKKFADAGVVIPIRLPAAWRFRVGLRAVNDGEAKAAFACSGALEFIQNGLQAL